MPITTKNPDHVEFGAVYFRKTNPPSEDWARDYAVAREDGHTIFRHWVPWAAVEVAPNVFDWSDFDRQLDLAAQNGIKTVLAEIGQDVPEWLYHRYPHARREQFDGKQRRSEMHVSCVVGGNHCMCLDNPEVADAMSRFLRAMARRYKDHPGLYAYDVWNECTYYRPELVCYCPATQKKFRLWLQKKYGDLKNLALAWKRYSFTSWDEVQLPRQPKHYPDVMDGIAFQIDNAYAWLKWRVDEIRSEDDQHIISAHGNAKTHCDAAPACGDDWRAGELVDLFGYTFFYGNDCDPVFAGDMIRSAARGREFWRAEAVGDSDWLDRRIGDKTAIRQDAMHDPQNIRLDCLISLMTGARGFMNPRWRPLLDGPLFGGFGWYDMSGARTDRSEMIRGLASWANTAGNKELWQSRPTQGDIALLFLDEAQAHCYALHGSTDIYSKCVQGAYSAFQAAGIQADPIKIDQLTTYRVCYVPYSLSLTQRSIDILVEWVRNGGTLVGEAAFGYLDENAHAFAQQPSRGLDVLFGAKEASVNLGVDRWDGLNIQTQCGALPCGLHRQSYSLTTGAAQGYFEDGSIAVVDNVHGRGRGRLVGSMPSYGYLKRGYADAAKWFRSALDFAGVQPQASHDGQDFVVRLSETSENYFLWVVNRGLHRQKINVTIGVSFPSERATLLRGEAHAIDSKKRLLHFDVDGRDAAILSWKKE